MPRFVFRPYREPARLATASPHRAREAFPRELILAQGFVVVWSMLRFGVGIAHGLDFEGALAGVLTAAMAVLLALSARPSLQACRSTAD